MELLEYRNGRLKIKEIYKDGKRKMVKTICDCGNEKVLRFDSFKKITKSCGCLLKEKAKKQGSINFRKHNLTGTHIHNVWRNMKERCYNKNNNRYYVYGGKGVNIFKSWKINILEFYKWSLNNGYVVGMSIERIDNNKNYCPENCIWIPLECQVYNKTTNYKIICKNETLNLKLFSVKHNFSLPSLYHFVERNNIPKIIKEETFLSQYLAKPRKKFLGRCND